MKWFWLVASVFYTQLTHAVIIIDMNKQIFFTLNIQHEELPFQDGGAEEYNSAGELSLLGHYCPIIYPESSSDSTTVTLPYKTATPIVLLSKEGRIFKYPSPSTVGNYRFRKTNCPDLISASFYNRKKGLKAPSLFAISMPTSKTGKEAMRPVLQALTKQAHESFSLARALIALKLKFRTRVPTR